MPFCIPPLYTSIINMRVNWLALPTVFAFADAQTGSATTSPIPTIASSLDNAPTFIPTIEDPTAPDSQEVCAGYTASSVKASADGNTITADLTLAGSACNTYGTDIEDLSLLVEYQTKERLHVQILPRYLTPQNTSWFFLPEYISGYPSPENHTTNDLAFNWSNEPSFQFEVSRTSTGEVLFSTYGHIIVYQNQFLELATSMVKDYNVYGLAENTHDFRLGNNYTQTFWAVDAGNTVDYNMYGTHPMYIETRWGNGTTNSSEGANSTSHGVYARNAHAQEWLLRSDNITYRTTGGSFDFYFLSGSKPKDVIVQYQAGIVGKPIMQQYWTFGLNQCRWGYQNWSVLQDVVDNYRKFDIPLETIWTDIDYMSEYRDFTNGAENFPVPAGQAFLGRLHAAGQRYVPIIDANIYVPDPTNSSDAYSVFERGNEMNVFIRDGEDSIYIGAQWPGFSTWPDFTVPQAHDFWSYEVKDWHGRIPFDGLWLDLNEASSYVSGSQGEGRLTLNPSHPPFLLPGDPGDLTLGYPEGFNITNATEAASASAAAASQSSATATSVSTFPAIPYTAPTPGSDRQLNFPPYAINNVLAGHSLYKSSIAPNATHQDAYNTTEYDLHNVFGHMSLNATRNALFSVKPNERPFVIGRSTFAGSGTVAAHWGGDNNSKWGSMYFSIAQALQFMIAGIPMFGVDACGFSGNTDYELCTRWMELAAFYPFYRNHNNINSIAQEPYVWASTATATRTVTNIRYSLLPYIYTLFHKAHSKADTVLNALIWEFPDDGDYIKGVDSQFMLGPSLLITPVLEPIARTVKGVFPGVASGTVWYDWYTLEKVQVAPYENKTLDAPLEHINVHVRGGSILPMQTPGYTTNESRNGTWELLVALDKDGMASGEVYIDDGVSEVQNATKTVTLSYSNSTLAAMVEGAYEDGNALDKLTVAGMTAEPKTMSYKGHECFGSGVVDINFTNGTLVATGLKALAGAAWNDDWQIEFGY